MLKHRISFRALSSFFSCLFYFYLFSLNGVGVFVSSRFFISGPNLSFGPVRKTISFCLGGSNKVLNRPALRLPRRVRERVVGGLFLRFLEAFFGSKVFFFFIRNA